MVSSRNPVHFDHGWPADLLSKGEINTKGTRVESMLRALLSILSVMSQKEPIQETICALATRRALPEARTVHCQA